MTKQMAKNLLASQKNKKDDQNNMKHTIKMA